MSEFVKLGFQKHFKWNEYDCDCTGACPTELSKDNNFCHDYNKLFEVKPANTVLDKINCACVCDEEDSAACNKLSGDSHFEWDDKKCNCDCNMDDDACNTLHK